MWHIWYLQGFKTGSEQGEPVATFGSEQQLQAYVSWATLAKNEDGTRKFEQGSALAGCDRYEYHRAPVTAEGPEVPHNPSPSML